MAPPLFAFDILAYRVNPFFTQPGQDFNLLPVPGFSATSYSISGTLPDGITFNTTTGAFTGPATTVTPATILTVTATLAGGGTSVCTVIIEVTDIPVEAIVANQASATGLTNTKLIAEQNWLQSVEDMVQNAQLLGNFWIYAELPDFISFRWAYFYLSKLNFVVQNVSPSNDPYLFVSFFGEFETFPGPAFGPFEGTWNDFTQPYNTVRSHPVRKVRISWSPFRGWLPFPPYGF